MKVMLTRRLDEQSPVPLYHQLRELLLEKIKSGEWTPGTCLPTEDEFCEMYQISKTTVRQALNSLAIEGWLRRKQGRGTYVAEPRIEQGPMELTSFSEEMRQRGLRPASKILELKEIPATSKIAKELELGESESVFMIKRLRLANDEPMGIQTAYLPAALLPGLLDEDLSGSLYQVLEEKYGIIPASAIEMHYATLLDGHEAELLGMSSSGSVGLVAKRRTFSQDGRPIEFVSSVMRGDRYQISILLVQRGFENPATTR
ncbi:GntR family transcriptional regulator [Candidatus Bipolaricaulota bacterium]|nr:GntR family transcriptional regulator [Candidatus Bipolaricaulota bacterium]